MVLVRVLSIAAVSIASALALSPAAQALDNEVEMIVKFDKRCFVTNGIPDHDTGTFPNRGNPNRIAKQDINVCVPENRHGRPAQHRNTIAAPSELRSMALSFAPEPLNTMMPPAGAAFRGTPVRAGIWTGSVRAMSLAWMKTTPMWMSTGFTTITAWRIH